MNDIVLLGFEQATITNDILNLIRETGQSVSVLTPEKFLTGSYNSNSQYIITVTQDMNLRKQLSNMLEIVGLKRGTFVHRTAVVDPTAVISPGTVLYPFTTLLYKTNIGLDCIITPYSMIAHQTTIGKNNIILPGTLIAGSNIVGDYCVFGLRSSVIDKLLITDNVKIGAGSLVTKNIEVSGTYAGNPARKVSQ
jgi:acetyltransferase-like isoleucine patch superfamily enzyme